MDRKTAPAPVDGLPRFDASLAACRGMGSKTETLAVFFPEKGEGAGAARAICAGCPTREGCLLRAVLAGEGHGIWGGAGEQRRRRLRRAWEEGEYAEVAAAHWRQLDGVPLPGDRGLLDVATKEAQHARRGRYAKGCRCASCTQATSFDTVVGGGRLQRLIAARVA